MASGLRPIDSIDDPRRRLPGPFGVLATIVTAACVATIAWTAWLAWQLRLDGGLPAWATALAAAGLLAFPPFAMRVLLRRDLGLGMVPAVAVVLMIVDWMVYAAIVVTDAAL